MGKRSLGIMIMACMAIVSELKTPNKLDSTELRMPYKRNAGRLLFNPLCPLCLIDYIDGVIGLFNGILDLKRLIVHVVTNEATRWMKVGQTLIEAPLKIRESVITAATDLSKLGEKLGTRIVSDIELFSGGSRPEVKAFDFPGSNELVLSYPSGILSVLSKAIKTVMHLGFAVKKMVKDHVKATLAWGIYMSVNVVVKAFSKALKIFQDCLPLPPMNIPVDNALMSSVKSDKTKVCGISSLQPLYNVTLTRDDRHFLVIRMPFKCENLLVHSESLTVPDGTNAPFIDKEPLEVSINTVRMMSEIKFKAGSALTFLRIHFEIEKLENFTMRFPSKNHSPIMDTVEGMSDYIGGVVKKEINRSIKKLENLVSDILEGKTTNS